MAEIESGSVQNTPKSVLRGSPPAHRGTLASSGEYWTIGFDDANFSLKDVKGLHYLQRLLQHPGEEFHALDLLGGPAAATTHGDVGNDVASLLRDRPDVTLRGLGDAGPMLDERAKLEYRRRLLELKEELDDLRERGAHARAAEVEVEIDALEREIFRAVGLGGRDRRAGSTSERARLNVTRAIRAALQKISERQPPLGLLLEKTINTGTFCSYSQRAEAQIVWSWSLEGGQPAAATELGAPQPRHRQTAFLASKYDPSTFVGRQAERSVMRSCLERALRGEGRVVMLAGPPGVGKTRTTIEFAREAAQRGCLVLGGVCPDRDDAIPFNPFVQILEEAFALAPNATAFRDALGDDAAEVARLMPQLRRPSPEIPLAVEPSPEQSRESRRSLFKAIENLIVRYTVDQPLLLLLEDLHWADEGSLSLLGHLSRSVATSPLMIVGTYRNIDVDTAGPLYKLLDDLVRQHQIETITLGGLSRDTVAELIKALSGRNPSAAVTDLIYSNTEGNPFFVEELFRHLVENCSLIDGDGEFRSGVKLAEVDVPQSLKLVIARRLRRLQDETRRVLAGAAALGRSFTFELLEGVAGLDADPLLDCVEEAERAGLINSTPEYPDAKFQFSHELIRREVLSELSVPRRQRLHLRVVAAIERIHADAIEDWVNDIANHLWRAGASSQPDKTVRYLSLATKLALQQSAYDIVLEHSERALALLMRMPDTQERVRFELDLQISRGVALVATRGWSVAASGEAYRRARELCEKVGEDDRLFSVLFGLWSFYLTRGEHPTAKGHAEEMLRVALRSNDDGMLVQAHWAAGCSQFFIGEFIAAKENLEQAIGRYEIERHRTLAFRFAQDPYLSSLVFKAVTLWMLGYPDQAETNARAALSFARQLKLPFSLNWCLEELTAYYSIRCDFANAARLIEEGVPSSRAYGYAYLEEALGAYQMIAFAAQGRMKEFAESSRRARRFSEIEYEIRQTWVRSTLAEALSKSGKLPLALSLISEAGAIMERNDERFVEPEIHRIRGELILRRTEGDSRTPEQFRDAEKSLRAAIESAQRRSAKMLELRAVISLGRLLAEEGRGGEARRIVKETCAWFSEGFDTPEFKMAQELMSNLSSAG